MARVVCFYNIDCWHINGNKPLVVAYLMQAVRSKKAHVRPPLMPETLKADTSDPPLCTACNCIMVAYVLNREP